MSQRQAQLHEKGYQNSCLQEVAIKVGNLEKSGKKLTWETRFQHQYQQ